MDRAELADLIREGIEDRMDVDTGPQQWAEGAADRVWFALGRAATREAAAYAAGLEAAARAAEGEQANDGDHIWRRDPDGECWGTECFYGEGRRDAARAIRALQEKPQEVPAGIAALSPPRGRQHR